MPVDEHDIPQLDTLDAALDALDSPSTLETFRATKSWDADMVAAAAAQRAINGGGGGGGSQPIQTGSGSPVGAVTPTAIGYLYIDTDAGAFYVSVGATDADWVAVSGPGDQTIVGVTVVDGQITILSKSSSGATKQTVISDPAGLNGTGNGFYWNATNVDGAQFLDLFLGSSGQFNHRFKADGTYTNANGIVFPSSDPHIAGAWWDDAGTLTKSAG